MSVIEKLPVVRVALGDSYDAVRENSSYRFSNRTLSDSDLIVTTKPVSVVIRNDGSDLALPPALFLGLDMIAWQVGGISASPQLEYLPLGEIIGLVDRLGTLLSEAGWRQAEGYAGRLAQLQSRAAKPDLPEQFRQGLGRWRINLDEAILIVERMHSRKGHVWTVLRDTTPVDQFLLTLRFENDALRKRLRAQMRHK